MVLGIDLGTTNSLACVFKDGEVVQIPNHTGDYLTPSVVSIDEDGTVLVGRAAKERKETHPDKTFSSFKRYMGTDAKFIEFTPEDLSSFVLRSLKQDAETFLGEEIKDVIISVPAYFDDKARKATRNAGRLAGLNVLRIINEPSAAALGFLKKSGKLEKIDSVDGLEDATFLVFDFGGGTLDVSLVEAFENVIEILSVAGDNMLGGIDFDRCLADEFCRRKGIKKDNIKLYNTILSAAEQCKKELTNNKSSRMVVRSEKYNDEIEITDKEYLKISEDVLRKIGLPINRVLLDSKTTPDEISDVVLVGGSSKMPIVQQYLKYILRGMNIRVYEPDYMIAYGMGVYAGIMERNNNVKDLLLTDVCPFSLGTAIYNSDDDDRLIMSFIIPRNTSLPISKTEKYSTAKHLQQSVEIDVYQGEEMYVKDNIKIGSFKINFPKPADIHTALDITFTYDINGILIVDVEVPAFGIKREEIMINSEDGNEEENEKKIEYLRKFKLLSMTDEDNRLIREWGERLYPIAPPMLKAEIIERLRFFEHIVKNGDPYQSIKFKKNIKSFFLAIELSLTQYDVANWTLDDSWKDDIDHDMEVVFHEWEEKDKNEGEEKDE